tara:strand:- start:209 stop:541 length:333 start_codon:yes stop_codon:yes gene_type:complete
MNKISLYFGLCILIRLLLTYGVFLNYNNNFRILFVLFYFISALGLFYHFITKNRKKGAFSQNIWWDFLRPIHGTIFILVAILLYYKYKNTYMLLLIDTLIGIYFFMKHRL